MRKAKVVMKKRKVRKVTSPMLLLISNVSHVKFISSIRMLKA